MRKIEKQMLQAIRSGRAWQSDNTAVFTAGGIVSVHLHGNRIASSAGTGTGYSSDPLLVPDVDTFKRWPTRTTVSRLSALGINASIRKGIPCINGEPV